jgi:hypothetical protein
MRSRWPIARPIEARPNRVQAQEIGGNRERRSLTELRR